MLTYGLDPGADVTAEAVAARGAHGMTFELVARAPRAGAHPRRDRRARPAQRPERPGGRRRRGSSPGSPTTRIAAGLATPWGRASAHRGVVVDAPGLTILDDTYNASPPAVVAALEVLATPAGTAQSRCSARCASSAPPTRRATARWAPPPPGSSAELVVVGPAAAGIAAGAVAAGLDPRRVHAVADRDEAVALLRTRPATGRRRPGEGVAGGRPGDGGRRPARRASAAAEPAS